MASKLTAEMGVVIVVVAAMMMWNGATAQSNGCVNALVGLTPCLTYVTGNSSAPSSSCCTQLSGVVQSNPQCLCLLLNGGGSNLGVNINQSLALALPAACKVQTPPVSQCNAAAGPTSAAAVPAGSPVGSQAPPSSEPKGTPQVPSTRQGQKQFPRQQPAPQRPTAQRKFRSIFWASSYSLQQQLCLVLESKFPCIFPLDELKSVSLCS